MPGQLGMIAGQAAQAGLGLMLQRYQDKRTMNMQRKLQHLQIQGQEHMAESNYARQMRMWHETNYGPQMEELRKAGLNPGLIYGMSGGGGATAAATPGQVTGGQAPTESGLMQSMMGMGIQRELLQAQKENIQADTEKKKVEASKTAGVDTDLAKQTIEGIKQTIQSQITQQALTRAQTALTELDTKYAAETMENRKSLVNLQLSKIIEEVRIIENDREISDATKQDAIDTIRRQALQVYLENQLIKSQTALTDEQKKVATQQIATMIATIEQNRWRLSIEDLKTELEHFREMGMGQDDDFKDILRGLGIILPIPGNKGRTVIQGFRKSH